MADLGKPSSAHHSSLSSALRGRGRGDATAPERPPEAPERAPRRALEARPHPPTPPPPGAPWVLGLFDMPLFPQQLGGARIAAVLPMPLYLTVLVLVMARATTR